jgi:hypothetical protein
VRSYDDDEFLPWYRKATVGWLELSAIARGILVSVSMELNPKTGALHLRRGLGSLAILLRLPAEDVERGIAELIAAEKLAWNGSTFTLSDPEYMARKRSSSADRMARKRARDAGVTDVTPCDASDVTRVTDKPSDGCDVTSPLLSSDLISSSQRGEPERGPPPWFVETVEAVCMDTGEKFAAPEAWLRYSGHRATKGIAPNAQDARYWLGTVMVPEARKERRAESDRKLNRQQRDGPPSVQRETPEQAKEFARQLAERVAARKGAA